MTSKKSSTKLCLLIGLILLSFYHIAYSSSYTTNYSFDSSVKGPTHSFDGQSLAFKTYARSIPGPHVINKTYNVTLYRDNGWFNVDKVGEVTLNRDTTEQAEWSNVGPGSYYLYFDKTIDGITLEDKQAKIYNY